jgi:hypothetical protein
MKIREFKKHWHKVKEVKYRYVRHEPYETFKVLGADTIEKLFKLEAPLLYGGHIWARCESVIAEIPE